MGCVDFSGQSRGLSSPEKGELWFLLMHQFEYHWVIWFHTLQTCSPFLAIWLDSPADYDCSHYKAMNSVILLDIPAVDGSSSDTFRIQHILWSNYPCHPLREQFSLRWCKSLTEFPWICFRMEWAESICMPCSVDNCFWKTAVKISAIWIFKFSGSIEIYLLSLNFDILEQIYKFLITWLEACIVIRKWEIFITEYRYTANYF